MDPLIIIQVEGILIAGIVLVCRYWEDWKKARGHTLACAKRFRRYCKYTGNSKLKVYHNIR